VLMSFRPSAWPVLGRPGGTNRGLLGLSRRVPVEGGPGPVIRMVVLGSAWEAASCTSRSGTPASSAVVMNVPERVRADALVDPGTANNTADDTPGTAPVQSAAVGGEEDWSIAALTDRQVDRPCRARRERDGDDLAALAGDHQSPVPALHAQGLDVGTGGLRDP
jgi:hypothetical protein